MSGSDTIVILTGAGISAESGLRTFRAQDGLWENHRIEDVATPEAFARDPALVQRFYNARRRQLASADVQPNAAHHALARLEREWPGEVLVVTQNVDDLHERAGTHGLIHMHGELNKARCLACDAVSEWKEDIEADSRCPRCGGKHCLRPHIVWFGEVPLAMDEIADALARCQWFLSIGTSGHVYPAAGFVQWANQSGAHSIEMNVEPSLTRSHFAEGRVGPASQLVPQWVEALLQGGC